MRKTVVGVIAIIVSICVVVLVNSEVEINWTRNPNPVTLLAYKGMAEELYADANMTSKQLNKQAKLLRLYNVTREFIEVSKVEWWLDFASLLGWYRDGKLLARDYDVDFSLMEDQFMILEKNKKWLHQHDCFWTDRRYRHKGRAKAVVSCRWFDTSTTNGADIYGFKGHNSILYPATYDGCKLGKDDITLPCASSICPEQRSWYFPLNCSSANILHGQQICVPRKTHRVLIRYYGSVNRNAACKSRCCVGGSENPPVNPVNDTPALPFWHHSGKWQGGD